MGNFIKDKKRGEIGEKITASILKSENSSKEVVKSVGRVNWDFAVDGVKYETKYDEMAKDTGNICFEVSNGTKLTGIFASEAHFVFYIIPTNKANIYEVFKMNIVDLIAWLKSNEKLTRAVNGGDKSKFSLLLVKKDVLLAHIKEVGQYTTWTEGA